jgi:hypothetical protein
MAAAFTVGSSMASSSLMRGLHEIQWIFGVLLGSERCISPQRRVILSPPKVAPASNAGRDTDSQDNDCYNYT